MEVLAGIGPHEETDGWLVVPNTEELCGMVCHICKRIHGSLCPMNDLPLQASRSLWHSEEREKDLSTLETVSIIPEISLSAKRAKQ